MCVLCVVAVIFGYLAYYLLSQAEQNLARTQFQSIASRALSEARSIAYRKRWAALTMADVASESYPNAEQWPFVKFRGFERVSRSLLNASSGTDLGLCPIVYPQQQKQFEDFAYELYNQLGFPNGTGVGQGAARGIWGVKNTSSVPYKAYHENGTTTWGSPYKLMTPALRTNRGASPVLMYDQYSEEVRGRAINTMLDCAEQKKVGSLDASQTLAVDSICGVTSEFLNIVQYNGEPGYVIFRPIFPRDDPLTIVGYIAGGMMLSELLKDVFADEVSGIDAVISSPAHTYTYVITNGIVEFVGKGNLYDGSHEKHKQTIILSDNDINADGSPTYILALSPNDDFFQVYETKNPWVASIGSVLVIVITSLCFFLYDLFVRQEFHAKRELLEARRQFMRFVSHEVRTPLNAVCMGLELVQNELAKSLGYDSATRVRALTGVAKEAESNEISQMISQSSKQEMEWFLLTQEIRGNAQGAIDILNDLLNYDKIEQGTLQLEEELICILELVENCILEFKLPAMSKSIRLGASYSVQQGTGLPNECSQSECKLQKHHDIKLLGDPIRVTQVFRNILSNALKFTPAGGDVDVAIRFIFDKGNKIQTLTVDDCSLITVVSAGRAQVTIKDTGAGLSSDQITKLFSDGLQFNVNQLQAGQGSGLGLFIAKGIVEQHSGTLTVASEGLGYGTAFTVTLPLWEVVASVASPKCEDEWESTRSSPNSCDIPSWRILIVDDVQSNRKLLTRLLEAAGHICEQATDGKNAVEMVKQSVKTGESYDCILMDYEMPVMDGPSAAKEIRAAGLDTLLLGITGNVLPEDVEYFQHCGANGVLSKPVRLGDIEALWMEHGMHCGKLPSEQS